MNNLTKAIYTLFLTLLLIGAITVILTLLPTIDNRESLKPEYQQRLAQWQSQSIDHYEITVTAFTPPMVFCSDASIEVKNHQVVEIEWIGSEESDFCDDEMFNSRFSTFTIDRMFEIVENLLYEQWPDSPLDVTIEYDAKYGYPTSISMYNKTITHLPSYSVSDFRVVTD